MLIARRQTLVQLSDELIALLDERAVRRGQSRSELIREAIEAYVSSDADAEIDRQIVEGYKRYPDDEFDDTESTKRMIAEEPW